VDLGRRWRFDNRDGYAVLLKLVHRVRQMLLPQREEIVMKLSEARIYRSDTIPIELGPNTDLEASAIADDTSSRKGINQMKVLAL
jgi:hypothetical protein